ncbi:type II CAAX prenyl endopeptidase Rce1 family protein [Labilibaculum sp.]|uniref:CPBP family glutamic-type intramembrane protease n=1 Tax=Labilibaculum sp. TaxID=2060723 RepID=UPI00356AFC80
MKIQNKKHIVFGSVFCYNILIKAVFIFIIYLFFFKNGIPFLKSDFELSLMKREGKITFVVFALVLAPIFEELLTRSWLVINNKTICLFISAIGYYVVLLSCSGISFWYRVLCSIIVFTVVFFLVRPIINKYTYELIQWSSKSNIYLLQIVSAVLFGVLHIMRCDTEGAALFVRTMEYIMIGFGFGYLRIKNGLNWSILFHSANNFIPVVLTLLH